MYSTTVLNGNIWFIDVCIIEGIDSSLLVNIEGGGNATAITLRCGEDDSDVIKFLKYLNISATVAFLAVPNVMQRTLPSAGEVRRGYKPSMKYLPFPTPFGEYEP